MTDPAEKRRATYQDVLDAPEHIVAEIVAGELHLFPRPAGPATAVASVIGEELGPPFKRGRGGPGGWLILDEPEVHLGDDIVVPDLAGWRRERLPLVPDAAFISVAPDWVCEVLSPSTERFDRAEKLPLYASVGVEYAWLVHPRRRTVEAFRVRDGKWVLLAVHKDDERARIEPFDAIELDLALLWSDVPLPTRASEEAAEYEYAARRILDLGARPFRDVWALQLELVEQRQRDEVPDTLIVVEHPHVFTLGRKREAEANVLAAGDVEVIGIERGGDVTYHGPGQLVAYPIVLLREGERDLHRYLRSLEAAVIATCARFGLAADREPGKTGVWTTTTAGRKKLCSLGIACRKWVCFHGLALNVTTDLAYFSRINPCGFESTVMTSMHAQLGAIEVAAVRGALADELGRALERAAL